MKRIVSLMILLTVCWVLPAVALAAEPVGSVTFVKGKADITRPGQDAEPLVKGDDIYVGDVVRTKTNAKVEITFIDESIVRVAQKSRLQITEYMFEREERRSTLSLFRGKIQSLVKKVAGFSFGQARKNRFEIRTPTAVCGVRGTDFFTWFMNGQTGTAFKEGQGYIYPANNPALSRNINTNEAGYVDDPDAAPVVKPATDADLEQHLEDTMPTEGEEGGDGGDDPGAGLTMDGGDTGDTGGTGGTDGTGGLTNDDKVLLDLRETTTITGITLFSGEAFNGFLTDGLLDGEIDDDSNQGPMTLTGSFGYGGGPGPGDTVLGSTGGSLYLPDDTEIGAFDGELAGVGGSWKGLMVSLYAQEPEVASGSNYDVGYLYGALSSPADYSAAEQGDSFSATGTAYRSQPLGQVSLVPEVIEDETETLQEALTGKVNDPALNLPAPKIDGTLDAGKPVSGSVLSGGLTTLSTNSGRVLGINTAESGGSFSNPESLGSWASIYGYSSSSHYFLGSVNGTDDLAGHIAYSGNLTYMGSDFLGNVNLWSRATDGEGLGIVAASAVTLDPLAYSGDWGGDSIYANDAGTFDYVASDYGIMGGRNDGELVVYGQFGSAPEFEPNEKYLYNTDLYVTNETLEINGISAGFWKMRSASSYGPNRVNYGLINGEAVALFRDLSTDQIGIMASKDIAGRFYPRVSMTEDTYGNIEMFNLVGSWVRSSPEDGSAYPDLYSHAYMPEASLVGDFNGSGSIAGGLDSGYTSYFYGGYGGDQGPGWGIYSIKLGSGSAENETYRTTSDTAWSAKLGGKADFGAGTPGYFLADVNGTWTLEDHAEITGTVLGTYLSETHIGQLTGPFYGTNVSDVSGIGWIGESIGIFEGDWVDFSGQWGEMASSLYSNDSGHMIYAGDDPGIFGVKTYADGHTEFLAMGSYREEEYGDRYLWNSVIDGQQLLPQDTGDYQFDYSTVFDGFTAGLWLRDDDDPSSGALSGTGWFLVNDKAGNGRIMRADLTGEFFEMPLSFPDGGSWYAESGSVQTLLPDVKEQYKTGISGASLGYGSIGVGAMGGSFAGDGFSGFGGDVLPDSEVLFLTDSTKGDLPWGVYNIKLGAGGMFTRRPAGISSWSGVIAGGEAFFDDGSGDGGMFIASANGTWNDAGEIVGKVGIESTAAGAFGKYMTSYQIGGFSDTGGGIGGDFTGINSSEGTWIGQSVGSFSGSLLSLSGGFDGQHPEFLYDGYGGFYYFSGLSSTGGLVDGLVGTIADPTVETPTSYYVMGHSIANTPIMSVAADLHTDASGKQYFTLLDFYSGSPTLTGYGVGLYADSTGNLGYANFSGLSGTHYGKVPVFDAEGQIALETPLSEYTYSGLVGNPVTNDGEFTLSAESTSFYGGLCGETYTFDSVNGAPGVHRTLGFGYGYDGAEYTDMYWAMTSIGRYEEGEGLWYLGAGSHAELYYLAVDDELDTGVLGRLGGQIEGSPYGTLTLSGAPIETDLVGWTYWGEGGGESLGSLHHYGNTGMYYPNGVVGHDTGILAGYYSDGQLKLLAMGEFDVDPDYSVVTEKELVWATSLGESQYSGEFWEYGISGFTGGVWSGGVMDGKVFMVVDRVEEGLGYGILLANILGNYYELDSDEFGDTNNGGWLASGDTTWIRMADTVASELLADDDSEPLVGSGESYPGSAVTVSFADVTGTSFQDEPWGVWGSYLYGTQDAAADFSSWHLSLTDDGGNPSSPMWVEVSGGRKTGEDRILEGRAAGAWVDLENAVTGILGGPVKGTFDPNSMEVPAWQAVAGGAFMETGKFLSMVQNDPGSLDQLMIPRFEVGRTDLTGSTENMSVSITDMIFFAHSTGASPTIWAADNVSGSYGSLPYSGESVTMNGAGFSNVNFQVQNFTPTIPETEVGNWSALIDGAGTVPGTTHNVQIDGGAAGGFDTGTFSGTGAGVAKPAGE
ncbi:MAG: FecR domain-containing protein [Desulfobacterales bacterium]|nr:FecR domain-containing protein [Desulfobacterales bacterium]